MDENIKAMISKAWRKETADLTPGKHFIQETMLLTIEGNVERLADQEIAPTVSIPLIPALALFFEKAGISRNAALAMLKEALLEAMNKNVKEDKDIKARIKDVESAVRAIREDLIADLPKMRRTGALLVNGLSVELTPVGESELVAA